VRARARARASVGEGEGEFEGERVHATFRCEDFHVCPHLC